MAFRIFVVDDDPHYARLISHRLNKVSGLEAIVFGSGDEAVRHLHRDPDLVFLDIMMPGIGGIETLKRLRSDRPRLPVVMVSAQGDVETAVEAMRLGAYDYITKGQDDLVKLDVVVKNVREHVEMARELEYLRTEVAQRYGVDGLVGSSPAMNKVHRLLRKAVQGDLTVAIGGESGTGKELVARAIHFNSARQRGPFVVVNCAAIPRDLMETEFFGHEKGAFTGAQARKIGRFEQADGGTIFLDEVADLDLDLQAKLLRALQNYEIQRVGGNDVIRFDARVISATNRNLIDAIRAGRFREDLYYRLFQFPILLPPLRERNEDALLLADHFLDHYLNAHPQFPRKRISSEAKRSILTYAWPGNVRELKSAIERSVLLAEGEEITTDDLLLDLHAGLVPVPEGAEHMRPPSPQHRGAQRGIPAPAGDWRDALDEGAVLPLDEIKRLAVHSAFNRNEGNVDKAAVELGIGRATMYRMLKKYGFME